MIPKYISTSEDYQKFYYENFNELPASVRQRLLDDEELKHMRLQMVTVKLEFAKEIIESCYAKTGRRGMDPMVIFRSLLLMISYGCLSITKWVKKVKADIALQFLIGFWKIPSVASHYDFINRVSKVEPHMDDDLYPKGKNPRPSWRKKKKKYKRGEKLNQDENKTKRLNEEYSKNPERDRNRLSRTLERIFDLLVVRPSCEYFSILEDENLTFSGDGTALPVHSNPNGHRVKNPVDDKHTHRYTNPDADWGFDSYNEMFYFGHSLFEIAYHKKGFDLPLFQELNPASMHDSLPMITAVAHMLDVNPIKKADKVELPNAKTAIDGTKEHFNKEGVPVCMAGETMPRNGYDKKLQASMFRCPKATGRIKSCPYEKECNKTPYGRVLRVPDKTDPRLFGPFPYNSKRWKKIYNNRTSCERVNKRLLRDYNVEAIKCRSKTKLLFFSMLAGILVHLDSWIKIGR